MAASGLTPEEVRKAPYDLEAMGIASNDTALTAFVHAGVERGSRRRFQEAAALEESLIDLMREKAPDMTRGKRPRCISVRPPRSSRMRVILMRCRNSSGESCAVSPPTGVARVAAEEAWDCGDVRETLQVTLQRDWGSLAKTAELRRTAAGLLLDHLLSALLRGSRGTDLLAETTMGKLLAAVKSDLVLNSQIRHPDRLMDRALLWLHEQEVVRLNKGLAVFRPAMTILLKPEQRGFARTNFASLQLHYDEQIRQIHVMAEYAQHGLRQTADQLGLAMDYFSLTEEEFLERWLLDRDQETSRQTTPESWRAIVESLNNPIQRRIVADDREQTNVLVLAYNRHAAVEIRRRLADLIGDDARGVTVLTCHALSSRWATTTRTSTPSTARQRSSSALGLVEVRGDRARVELSGPGAQPL